MSQTGSRSGKKTSDVSNLQSHADKLLVELWQDNNLASQLVQGSQHVKKPASSRKRMRESDSSTTSAVAAQSQSRKRGRSRKITTSDGGNVQPVVKKVRVKPAAAVQNSKLSVILSHVELDNVKEFETYSWPTIRLHLPCLESSPDGDIAACQMCVEISRIFRSWYELHPHLLTYADVDSMDSMLGDVTRGNPRSHEHDITINDEHELALPELVEQKFRESSKRQKVRQSGTSTSKPGSKAASRTNSPERSIQGEREETVSDWYGGGVSMEVIQKQRTLEIDDQIEEDYNNIDGLNNTANDLELLACGTSPRQLKAWIKLVIKYLRDEFRTESTFGRKNIVRVTEGEAPRLHPELPLDPREHQMCLAEYIRDNFNWDEMEALVRAGGPNRRMLVYMEQGSGKTDALILPWQYNPPKRVIYVCDNIVIPYWVNKVQSYAQTSGVTIHEVVGVGEYSRRVDEDPEYAAGAVLVVDESHRYRCVTINMVHIMHSFIYATAVFHLTGTPLMNQGVEDFIGTRMYMGYTSIASMVQIRESEELSREHAVPTKGKQYERIFNEFKNNVFYFRPECPIPTERQDIRVPMKWQQAFEYIYCTKGQLKIGTVKFSTGNRNNFESLCRRVSNVVMRPGTMDVPWYSPKLDRVLEYILAALKRGDRKELPIVIYSQYLKRGILAMYKWLMMQPWALQLRIVMVTREDSPDVRDAKREAFNRGEIDILLLSPVAKQSYDLLDCAAIILLEVPDSQGAEAQIVARILRSAAARRRPDMVVKIIRMVATWPDADPTKQERDDLWNEFASKAGEPRRQLETEFDIVHALRDMMKELQYTADERRVARNIDKYSKLYPLDLIMRAASIPFGDVPRKFESELQDLFHDRLLVPQ